MNMVSEPVSPIVLWLMRARRLRLARRTNLLLVPLLAYQLAKLTWLLVPLAPSEQLISWPLVSVEPVAAPRQGDSRLIAAWHLFGEAGEEPPAPPPIPEEPPETTLQLTLRGCYSVESQVQALAIIADERGEERPYRIGDALPGGAVLREIYVNKVLLSRQGKPEVLRLPKEEESRYTGRNGDGNQRKWAGGRRERPYSVPQDPREVELMLDQYREFLENEPVEDDEH